MAAQVTFEEARSVLRDLELRQPVLEGIARLLEIIMLDTQRLRDEVAQTIGVNASAATLIRNLAQQLRDEAANDALDQAAVNEIADSLDGASDDLAAAVGEGSPAEPAPEEPPA